MAQENCDRVVLLNYLASSSVTRVRSDHPPVHGARELFEILETRRDLRLAVEFLGAEDDADEAKRIANGNGANLIRLSAIRFDKADAEEYIIVLVEFINEQLRKFPVVHRKTFAGREIEGNQEERGGFSAHILIKLPRNGAYDDGKYRCAIEVVPSVGRSKIAHLINRQLIRQASQDDWKFDVTTRDKKGKPTTKSYKYHPKLELLADASRTLNVGTASDRELHHIVFTKRGEKQEIGKPTAVIHADIIADLEVKVSAKQGPTEPLAKTSWWSLVRGHYETRGYATKLYFKHINGRTIPADVHSSIAEATDLLLCPRDVVTLPTPPADWSAGINEDMVAALKKLVDRDELWRTK